MPVMAQPAITATAPGSPGTVPPKMMSALATAWATMQAHVANVLASNRSACFPASESANSVADTNRSDTIQQALFSSPPWVSNTNSEDMEKAQ